MLFFFWAKKVFAHPTTLFTSSIPQDLERVLDGVEEVVTEDMNVKLAMEYIAEEVAYAIKEA